MISDKQYQCALCGGIFDLVRDKTWSEEKAIEEYKKNFSGESLENKAVVCDDCWKKITPAWRGVKRNDY